jgi:hypothetical protein
MQAVWRYLPLALSVAAIIALLIALNVLHDRLARLEHNVEENISLDVSDFEDIPVSPGAAIAFTLPTKMSFAGEPVPLHVQDVRERLDKELHINIYLHTSTIFLMKRAQRWLPSIDSILKQEGIPEDFKYLPLIESALLNDVSPKAAVGFWQILKSAGKEYGLEITNEVDERYDPLKSTRAASRYLKNAYKKFGDWTLAAASYNRGMAGVQRALDNQKVNNYYDLYLNDETSRYVFRILAFKEIINNPQKYGFNIKPEYLYTAEKVRYVEVTATVKNLIDFSLQQGINYKLLKRHNPWLREERLSVREGKVYSIAIPVITSIEGH